MLTRRDLLKAAAILPVGMTCGSLFTHPDWPVSASAPAPIRLKRLRFSGFRRYWVEPCAYGMFYAVLVGHTKPSTGHGFFAVVRVPNDKIRLHVEHKEILRCKLTNGILSLGVVIEDAHVNGRAEKRAWRREQKDLWTDLAEATKNSNFQNVMRRAALDLIMLVER